MGRQETLTRTLQVGDNLDSLAGLPDGSVNLIYLDPPFNSGRLYEAVLSIKRNQDQRGAANAFDDRWLWSASSDDLLANLGSEMSQKSAAFVSSLARLVGRTPLAAYLVMMAPRIHHLHRILHDAGSLYLHCDPSASHYLKILLDHVFGLENFRSEIVWRRTHAHSGSRRYGPIHDVILYYSKSPNYTWNPMHTEYRADYIDKHFRSSDERGRYQLITCTAPGDRIGTKAHYEWRGHWPPPGRHWAWRREQMETFENEGKLMHSANGVPRLKRYVDDGAGVPLQDLWLDIPRLDAHSEERIGYETQKPVQLLDRLIRASSAPGDVVLDPFCGSGTSLVAAEQLGRSWIGIDSSIVAGSLALARVRQVVGTHSVSLGGFPSSVATARRLRDVEPTAFGIWGASMLATLPMRAGSEDGLVTGIGKVQAHRRTVQIGSWVPVGSTYEPRILRFKKGLGTKLGVILEAGQEAAQLKNWIAPRMQLDGLFCVPMSALVDKASVNLGMSIRLSDQVERVV